MTNMPMRHDVYAAGVMLRLNQRPCASMQGGFCFAHSCMNWFWVRVEFDMLNFTLWPFRPILQMFLYKEREFPSFAVFIQGVLRDYFLTGRSQEARVWSAVVSSQAPGFPRTHPVRVISHRTVARMIMRTCRIMPVLVLQLDPLLKLGLMKL